MTNLHAPERPGPARSRRLVDRMGSALGIVEWGALALLIVAGLAAWWIGILHKSYDHDEVQRAHSVWLVSRGLRPYSEMFEVHPPYFVLLTPILRHWADPCEALRAFRIFSAAGNLAFLGALVALGWSPGARGKRWAVVGVAFVAFYPKVLDYLIEFRIDAWGYALGAWGAVLFLRRPEIRGRFATFGILSGLATLFFCPKLAFWPPLIVGGILLRERRTWRETIRRVLAYGLGVGIAGVVFALFLAWNRIALDRIYLLLFRYHTLSNANSAHRSGLLRQIVQTPTLLAPIALGGLAHGVGVVRSRAKANVYPLALGIWLVIQALLVAYHYKQYYAPWFLLASTFVVVLGRDLDRAWRPIGTLALVAGCGTTALAAVGIAQLWDHYRPARAQCAQIRALNVLAGPEDRVVAPPPEHPIVRRDAFFLWFNTSDPQGYDSERILETLGPYRPLVSSEGYRAALEADPPALVVLDAGPVAAPYPEGQWNALRAFLPRQGYRVVRLGSLRLALRPDRHEGLRSSGLFDDDPGPLGPVMPFAH